MECQNLRSLLGSVFRRNSGKWLRFILSILKNEADAEDVLQEAVRRVLARNVLLQSEEQVRMYLNRTIANAALEFYNCRKREHRQKSVFNDQVLVSSRYSRPLRRLEEIERSCEQERLLGILHEGLKLLPPKQYEALRLTILESGGLSIRDAGATNGIPYSTLRHRSKQGLRHLRRFLAQKEKSLRSA